MGGEAAKERRKLKRLQAQQGGADGKFAVPSAAASAGKPAIRPAGRSPKPHQTKAEKSAPAVVRMRLRRKMERKATGTFKAESHARVKPTSDYETKRKAESDSRREDYNRREERNTGGSGRGRGSYREEGSGGRGGGRGEDRNGRGVDGGRGWSEDRDNRGGGRGGGRDRRDDNEKHRDDRQRSTLSHNATNFERRRDKAAQRQTASDLKRQPAKKNSNAKHKVKNSKPKHLGRKMDQRSEGLVSGDNATGGDGADGADLERRLESLQEAYKELKQRETAPTNKAKPDVMV